MYFITTKRMLEVCFSAHPNIQYRTLYILTLGQAVPKLAAPAVDLRQPPFGSPTHKNLNGGKYNDYYQSERLLPLVLNQ
ncbi:hypothetical protein F180042I2_12670 [Enterocloster bolteae]